MILQRHRNAGRPQYIREEQFHVYSLALTSNRLFNFALENRTINCHKHHYHILEPMGNPWGTLPLQNAPLQQTILTSV